MIELFALAMLVMAALAVAAVVGTVLVVVKAVLWLLLLPFRLLFNILAMGVGLALGAVGLVAGIALLPLLLTGLAVFAAVVVIGALLSLLLPAIPFVLLGLVVWAIFFRDRKGLAETGLAR